MAVSFHKFIERLNRSGLLTTHDLQRLLALAPRDSRPGDAEALARWLVKQGHLTPFQAKAIYVGHTKGLIIGNYLILDLLGVGGMGQVYMAQHRRMKRVVALKLLSPEVAKRPNLVERFHQEVEAAARLMHPNIVTAFDADEADGKHFLVMEYVPGRDLASVVRERGRLSVDRSIRCILDAARGLEYAHNHGIVHRDVKPSNLLLASTEGDSALDDTPHARVKILDMGLARVEAEAEGIQAPADLTRTGIVMGTVDYMSPEQAVNTHDADHRSDIYSLGITLHFLLTGAVPFTGRTVIEQVLAHREAEIPSLKAARAEVPTVLDAIFRKMVAKRPDERYQSMREIVAELEGVLSGDESATDLPIVVAQDDDTALLGFLDQMSGDAATRQRATASVVTPSVAPSAGLDTLVTSDHSTAIGHRNRLGRRNGRPVPWGAVALHATWSLGLLGLAVWLFVTSQPANQSPDVGSTVGSAADGTATGGPAAVTAESAVSPDVASTPATVSDATSPMLAEDDVDRRLAVWLLAKGGSVMVADTTRAELILPGQELPRWAFSVIAITLPGSAVSTEDRAPLAEVAALRMLRTLVLAGCAEVDDAWIATLEPMARLDQLDLRETRVSDAGVETLAGLCPSLEVFHLGDCAIEGSGLQAVTELTRLRQLSLHQTPLKADALPFLMEMTSLRELDLRGTGLTRDQVDRLREALPDCTILARPEDL